MNHRYLAALSLGAALMAGCNKEEEKAPAPAPANTTSNAGTRAEEMAKDLKETASSTAGDAQRAAADAQKAAADKAAEAKVNAASATEATKKEAQSLFEQAMAYIREQKWDSADGAIKKLEALKSKLPAEWQTKIDELRKQFNTAKTTLGNVKLPSLGN